MRHAATYGLLVMDVIVVRRRPHGSGVLGSVVTYFIMLTASKLKCEVLVTGYIN